MISIYVCRCGCVCVKSVVLKRHEAERGISLRVAKVLSNSSSIVVVTAARVAAVAAAAVIIAQLPNTTISFVETSLEHFWRTKNIKKLSN